MTLNCQLSKINLHSCQLRQIKILILSLIILGIITYFAFTYFPRPSPIAINAITTTKEINFEVTDPTRSWEIGRTGTYDYAPSVLKEDNGETKVYVCGSGTGGDAIYLTTFSSGGVKTMNSKMVLSPVFSDPQSDGVEINTFTQTCVAFSDDGINWQKYNENIWTSKGRFANANEPPTAVIKISSLMAQTYGIREN